MSVVFESVAPRDVVLAAIKARAGVWRESELGASLRANGIYQITSVVRGERFELGIDTGGLRTRHDLVLTGTVAEIPSGGSRVTARCSAVKPRPWHFIPHALVGAAGAWGQPWGAWIQVAVLLSTVYVAFVWYSQREVAPESGELPRYLLDRLRHAISEANEKYVRGDYAS